MVIEQVNGATYKVKGLDVTLALNLNRLNSPEEVEEVAKFIKETFCNKHDENPNWKLNKETL